MMGRVLVIAGSDPSGGAGIQADIKTITALGGYAATAITALTVQNTHGVKSVHGVEASIISDQITAVLDDIGADAIKIGMIGSVAVARLIADMIERRAGNIPVVLDPVLAATSGDALAEDGMAAALMEKLTPLSAVVTPNADEAAALTGLAMGDAGDLEEAGRRLCAAGAAAALIKGGHLPGETVTDVLVSAAGVRRYQNPRLASRHTHGTGCTLASALATGLAQNMTLEQAVARAINYVHEAIKTAPGFGGGAGPLNHAWPVTDGDG